jgi:hypothetical protein
MFELLTAEKRLQIEQQKNKVLQTRIKELEDALIEIAEMAASNEEALRNG